jgi:hypothetical protein
VGGTCSMHGEGRSVCRILVGGPKGNRSLGKPRHRWEVNMKMDEVGITGVNWIHLAQNRAQ